METRSIVDKWDNTYFQVSLDVRHIAIGVEGQGLDSHAGQTTQSVANGLPPLGCFFRVMLLMR